MGGASAEEGRGESPGGRGRASPPARPPLCWVRERAARYRRAVEARLRLDLSAAGDPGGEPGARGRLRSGGPPGLGSSFRLDTGLRRRAASSETLEAP